LVYSKHHRAQRSKMKKDLGLSSDKALTDNESCAAQIKQRQKSLSFGNGN
jgi:hypothetical protein